MPHRTAPAPTRLGLVVAGSFDLRPGPRVGILESGTGWIPWWLHRMDAWSSDFPHLEAKWPDGVAVFDAIAHLDADRRAAVTWDTPCRLYGVDPTVGRWT